MTETYSYLDGECKYYIYIYSFCTLFQKLENFMG